MMPEPQEQEQPVLVETELSDTVYKDPAQTAGVKAGIHTIAIQVPTSPPTKRVRLRV